MTALSVAGDPSRHRYWVPDLSFIPEDEVVGVFQDPPLRFFRISLLPKRGTHRAVAADVEKFPFRHLRIKRIHAELCSAQQTLTMMTPPLIATPSPEPNTMSRCNLPTTTAPTTTTRTPVDLNEITRELIRCQQALRRMRERQQQQPSTTTTTTLPPEPTPTQDIMTTARSNLLPQITATTTTTSTPDRLLLSTTSMTMTTMTTPHHQPPLHDSSLTPPSSTVRKLMNPEPLNPTSSIPDTTELKLHRTHASMPTTPPDNDAAEIPDTTELKLRHTHASVPTTPPDNDAADPATAPTKNNPTPATATPFMPTQSRMERLLNNIQDRPIALWTPAAIYRYLTRNQLNAPDPTPTQSTAHVTQTAHRLATKQYLNNNSLLTNDDTSPYNPAFDIHLMLPDHCQISHQHHPLIATSVTSPFNPAFDIHLKLMDHRQINHQYHSLTVKYATSPFDPAFDIHLTDHRQKCHQHHTRLHLAPTVQAFTQNKRPP